MKTLNIKICGILLICLICDEFEVLIQKLSFGSEQCSEKFDQSLYLGRLINKNQFKCKKV